MKEIFANLFIFQLISSERLGRAIKLDRLPRKQRFITLAGIFLAIIAVQVIMLIKSR
jgi:t-SNARE complex subunit (syntaxin)